MIITGGALLILCFSNIFVPPCNFGLYHNDPYGTGTPMCGGFYDPNTPLLPSSKNYILLIMGGSLIAFGSTLSGMLIRLGQ